MPVLGIINNHNNRNRIMSIFIVITMPAEGLASWCDRASRGTFIIKSYPRLCAGQALEWLTHLGWSHIYIYINKYYHVMYRHMSIDVVHICHALGPDILQATFSNHFFESKICLFWLKCHSSGNGSVANRRQTITWTDVYPHLGHRVLTKIRWICCWMRL